MNLKSNAIAAFTVAVLRQGERYLLLQRAETKQFAPGRWTGIGGRVELDERRIGCRPRLKPRSTRSSPG